MNLLTTEEVAEKLSLSKNAFHQLRSRETSFPAPIKVSQKVLRWDASDVEEWLKSKKEVSDEGS